MPFLKRKKFFFLSLLFFLSFCLFYLVLVSDSAKATTPADAAKYCKGDIFETTAISGETINMMGLKEDNLCNCKGVGESICNGENICCCRSGKCTSECLHLHENEGYWCRNRNDCDPGKIKPELCPGGGNIVCCIKKEATSTTGETFSTEGEVAGTPTAGETKLTNPLGKVTPQVLIGKVINAILGMVGSIALLMFVYGGFLWLTAGGNPEQIKKGKDVLVWASIGLVVIFTSYALVHFIIKALGV